MAWNAYIESQRDLKSKIRDIEDAKEQFGKRYTSLEKGIEDESERIMPYLWWMIGRNRSKRRHMDGRGAIS